MRWVVAWLVVGCGASPQATDAGPSPPGGDAPGSDAVDAHHPTNIGCNARDCGPDGKGGSCGTCNTAFSTCDEDLGLCVPNNGGNTDVNVTFQGACWWVCPNPPPQGFNCTAGQRFQAEEFDLHTQFPIEATLYFDRTCDPADGTDNLNDTGAATPTQIGIEWFIHHPDEKPSSAVWWFGHHSTGCVDYTNAPDCP